MFGRKLAPLVFATLGFATCCFKLSAAEPARPNVLIFMADDWGFPAAPSFGEVAVKTPALDRIASEGVLFNRGYCNSPSCTPSRAALLTGQDVFRLEEGSCLDGPLKSKFTVYPDVLEAAGYAVGLTSKGWGPGDFRAGGRNRNPAGPTVKNFETFIRDLPADQPFCFWYGSTDPHRPYQKGSGIRAGIDPQKVIVPGFLPDTPEVRSDLCDYLFEVQRFNDDASKAMALLDEVGRFDNTLIIISGDNGTPFPRCKKNLYEWGVHVPLAMCWKGQIPGGRVIDDFVSFIDLAPTILEATGQAIPEGTTGRSLLPMLKSEKVGEIEAGRDAVVTARERHGRNSTYPMRSIRTKEYSYIRNFAPANPSPVADAGPTSQVLMQKKNDPAIKPFYDLCYGPRPTEELYDLSKDPDELTNVADDPEYQAIKQQLSTRLMDYLSERGDPRAHGNGDVFDNYVLPPRPGRQAASN